MELKLLFQWPYTSTTNINLHHVQFHLIDLSYGARCFCFCFIFSVHPALSCMNLIWLDICLNLNRMSYVHPNVPCFFSRRCGQVRFAKWAPTSYIGLYHITPRKKGWKKKNSDWGIGNHQPLPIANSLSKFPWNNSTYRGKNNPVTQAYPQVVIHFKEGIARIGSHHYQLPIRWNKFHANSQQIPAPDIDQVESLSITPLRMDYFFWPSCSKRPMWWASLCLMFVVFVGLDAMASGLDAMQPNGPGKKIIKLGSLSNRTGPQYVTI